MKQKYLLFAFLLFSFGGYSTPVLPSENCLLIDHLIEVNGEWAKKNLKEAFLFEAYHFTNDRDRIQKHLELVTYFLKQEKILHLTDNQSDSRQNQLHELANYWQTKQFPINTKHSQRQPYFVDDYGTACAVGHLVLESGENALVERISQENNYAYLLEMSYVELEIWAAENGFTAEELAWIQPTYQPQGYEYNEVGNNQGIEGHVNVMATSPDGNLLFFGGNFSSVDGVDCNNLIAFDGENWLQIGEGVNGEIFDMEFRNDTALYIVGDFEKDGYENLTVYNLGTENFTPLGISEMEGTIYTILAEYGLRIGGDFSSINGNAFQNLAHWDGGLESWSNSTRYFNSQGFHYIDNAFSVNGVVKDLINNNNNILVGGTFDLTAPDLDTSYVQNLSVKNLAYWGGGPYGDWVQGFNGDYGDIECLSIGLGGLYIGANNNDGIVFSQLSGGIWLDNNPYIFGDMPIIHEFTLFNDALIMVGNFQTDPLLGDISKNIFGFQLDGTAVFNSVADQEITATAVFQNQLFIAGEFEILDNQLINNIASTEFEPKILDATNDITTQPNNIYSAENQLFIKDLPIKQNSQLSLYNLQGQLVETFTLEAGQSDFQYSLAHLSSGAMVYYLETEDRRYSGKVVKF